MTDPRNFLLNSDYPLDKVVYLNNGSTVFDNATPIEIAHGLPFTPLVGGYWSFDADFSTTYEFYTGDFPSGNSDYIFAHEVDIESNATIITITMIDLIGDSKTFYYRLYAFQPDDYSADILPLASSGDNFVLNTDYNYMKLFNSDHFTMGTDTSHTVDHNLGFMPVAMGWYSYFGSTIPIIRAGDISNGILTVEVTTTSIVFSNPLGLTIDRVDFRLYADE